MVDESTELEDEFDVAELDVDVDDDDELGDVLDSLLVLLVKSMSFPSLVPIFSVILSSNHSPGFCCCGWLWSVVSVSISISVLDSDSVVGVVVVGGGGVSPSPPSEVIVSSVFWYHYWYWYC